jgi:cobalamin biosynthesis protein CobW
LVQAFGWPEIRTRTRVSGVVTVVDGEALATGSVVGDPAALEAQRLADPNLDHLSSIQELFDDQLDAADLVLLSRADRLEAEQVAALQAQITAQVRPGVSVLPMQRGEVPAALLLGLEREEHEALHDHHDHDEHHEHHEHEHHDHTHVAMQSAVVRWSGALDRGRLEAALESQIRHQTLLRLKGRAWLPGKRHPLQIQAVGPRLECWFDSQSPGERPAEDGLELVALGLAVDGAALEQAIQNA